MAPAITIANSRVLHYYQNATAAPELYPYSETDLRPNAFKRRRRSRKRSDGESGQIGRGENFLRAPELGKVDVWPVFLLELFYPRITQQATPAVRRSPKFATKKVLVKKFFTQRGKKLEPI